MHGAACTTLLLTAGASIPAEGQIIAPSPVRNVVYAEVGGAGGIVSLNSHRRSPRTGEGRIAEAGFAVVAGTYRRTRYGATEVDGTYASLVPTIGLRAEPPGGGFTYRITFSPLVPILNSASAFPRSSPILWGGMSAGYIFR